jgi:copper chaperone CopZ
MNQKLILGLIFLLFIGVAVSMSVVKYATPPKPHEHEESNIITAKLGEVDSDKAAVLTLKIEEMDCQNAASKVAESLLKLKFIGEVRVDLNKRTFSLVYDKEKLKEEDILEAIKAANFSPEVIRE